MARFQFQPLESPNEQIRLIQLLPRKACEPGLMRRMIEEVFLSQIAEEVPLNQRKIYTAVSYAWGDLRRRHRILVNNTSFYVTESLDIMLRHLQDEQDILTLWIDQLRINQDDCKEKESQVPMMKSIYQNASKVIVWLGPSAKDSNLVMDVLADVGKKACEIDLMKLTLPELYCWSDEAQNDERRRTKRCLDHLIERAGATFY